MRAPWILLSLLLAAALLPGCPSGPADDDDDDDSAGDDDDDDDASGAADPQLSTDCDPEPPPVPAGCEQLIWGESMGPGVNLCDGQITAVEGGHIVSSQAEADCLCAVSGGLVVRPGGDSISFPRLYSVGGVLEVSEAGGVSLPELVTAEGLSVGRTIPGGSVVSIEAPALRSAAVDLAGAELAGLDLSSWWGGALDLRDTSYTGPLDLAGLCLPSGIWLRGANQPSRISLPPGYDRLEVLDLDTAAVDLASFAGLAVIGDLVVRAHPTAEGLPFDSLTHAGSVSIRGNRHLAEVGALVGLRGMRWGGDRSALWLELAGNPELPAAEVAAVIEAADADDVFVIDSAGNAP